MADATELLSPGILIDIVDDEWTRETLPKDGEFWSKLTRAKTPRQTSLKANTKILIQQEPKHPTRRDVVTSSFDNPSTSTFCITLRECVYQSSLCIPHRLSYIEDLHMISSYQDAWSLTKGNLFYVAWSHFDD
ncbi:hypothetical protein KSP40_PGU015299 [Platanthera guangdongensis]|uniref:Anaphase-promoting complex subunit 13 n=1 Tax=Platanthera guangdongensis TaxID=2320717 RepID=A0ABR2MWI7_9ASPA